MKKVILFFSAILFVSGISAQNVIPGGKEKITIKGFVSATTFIQDQSFGFGNGQNAEWATPPAYTTNKWFGGMDIRNTRLTMVFNGPKRLHNWAYGGVIEMDFFGGFNGSSLFSAQMPMPRLRLAYMDFVHKNLRIRVGQAWTPMFGNVPVSLSHIAFPLGYGSAGFVGWRFPGIYLYWGLNGKQNPVKVRLDAALFTGSWNGPGANTNFLTGGNFGSPQMELKLNLLSKNWSIYLVGHYDKKSLAPVNVSAPDSILTGLAAEFGLKFHSSGFLFQGNVYTGKNIGQQFGAITQVQTTTHNLRSTGGWFQLGYTFPKHFGAFFFYGVEKVNHSDALAAFANPRTKNNLFDFMLKQDMGPVSIGLEWLHSNLTYGQTDNTVGGNQISLSGIYKF